MAGKAKTRKRSGSRTSTSDLKIGILNQSLDLAEEVGWSNLTFQDLANRMKISLAEIRLHYRDFNAVADAWFENAIQTMLEPLPRAFYQRPAPERLHILMMRWFDALAPHRNVTAQIINQKLYPAHPHHWVPMVFDLSRTIQWLRDTARLTAKGRRRQLEEVGLSTLFIFTLAVWTRDNSFNQDKTREFLKRRLERSDRMMVCLWGKGTPQV